MTRDQQEEAELIEGSLLQDRFLINPPPDSILTAQQIRRHRRCSKERRIGHLAYYRSRRGESIWTLLREIERGQ